MCVKLKKQQLVAVIIGYHKMAEEMLKSWQSAACSL